MGMRRVPMSLEVIRELLLGETPRGIPVNVPKDLRVVGSVKDPNWPRATVFLCESGEWDEGGLPKTGEISYFEPTYRRV